MTDEQITGQVSWLDQDTWSGKMSQERSQVPEKTERERTSKPCSRKSSKSSTQKPLTCLCLKREDGPTQGASTMKWGGWSIAWRLHDAQFWGVPQRRKRIALVADFGGLSAPEILFERKGLSRDIDEGEQTGEETSGDSGESTTASSYTLKVRGGVDKDYKGKTAGKGALVQTEMSGTLGVSQDQTLFALEGNGSRPSHSGDGCKETDKMYTLNTIEQYAVACEDKAKPLDAHYYKGCGERNGEEREVVCVGNGQLAQAKLSKTVGTLNCMHDQQAVLAFDRAAYNQGENAKYDFSVEEDVAQPIVARGPGGVMTKDDNVHNGNDSEDR